MQRLDENQRLRAIGMLQAGMAHNVVARHFGCHRNTILSLWRRFRQSGNTNVNLFVVLLVTFDKLNDILFF